MNRAVKAKPRKVAKRPTARRVFSLDVAIDDPAWRKQPEAVAWVKRAAREALRLGTKRKSATLTIVLADDTRLKALNADFRGIKKPTNVLSFPGPDPREYLGDIAIAYGVVAREAKAQKKRFSAHAAHLAAHGVLHLLGYDHFTDSEADEMEALEVRTLKGMGLSDPYATSDGTAAKTKARGT
jgi:probable rRNA maturation factor